MLKKRMSVLFSTIIFVLKLGESLAASIPELRNHKIPRSRCLRAATLSRPWFGEAEEFPKNFEASQTLSHNFPRNVDSWENSKTTGNSHQPLQYVENPVLPDLFPQQILDAANHKYSSNLPFQESKGNSKYTSGTLRKFPINQVRSFDSDFGQHSQDSTQNEEKKLHDIYETFNSDDDIGKKHLNDFTDHIKMRINKKTAQNFFSISDAELENLMTRAIVAARNELREIQESENNQQKLLDNSITPMRPVSQEIVQNVTGNSEVLESTTIPDSFISYVTHSIHKNTTDKIFSGEGSENLDIFKQPEESEKILEDKENFVKNSKRENRNEINVTSTEQTPENFTRIFESSQDQTSPNNIQKIAQTTPAMIGRSIDSIMELKKSLSELVAVVNNWLGDKTNSNLRTSTYCDLV